LFNFDGCAPNSIKNWVGTTEKSGAPKNFFRHNYYHHCAPPLLKSFRRLCRGDFVRELNYTGTLACVRGSVPRVVNRERGRSDRAATRTSRGLDSLRRQTARGNESSTASDAIHRGDSTDIRARSGSVARSTSRKIQSQER